jgi:Ala-tRNA(Pro) deacylase
MPADKVHELLDDHGISYETHEHPRAVSAQRLAAAEEVSGWEAAKPVLLSIGDQLALAVVPAAMQGELDRAREVLGGNEVRLATEDEFVATFPDSEPGAEPPFGNLYGVPVFLDERLRASPRLVCRDGSHTRSITLATEDYVKLVQPEIVELGRAEPSG